MSTRATWKSLLPWPAFGLALTIIGLAIFHARAQYPGMRSTGTCRDTGSAACFACDPDNFRCINGEKAPSGYTADQTCDQKSNFSCSTASYDCGTAVDCRTNNSVDSCGPGVGCSNGVLTM